MLKIWGVPFDILRLDEQRLQINRFLDGEAKPNYGCVIWMADPDKLKGISANYETLKQAVKEYGISMIALFDYIKTNAGCLTWWELGIRMSKNVKLGGAWGEICNYRKSFYYFRCSGIMLPDTRQLAGSSIPEANGITAMQVLTM